MHNASIQQSMGITGNMLMLGGICAQNICTEMDRQAGHLKTDGLCSLRQHIY